MIDDIDYRYEVVKEYLENINVVDEVEKALRYRAEDPSNTVLKIGISLEKLMSEIINKYNGKVPHKFTISTYVEELTKIGNAKDNKFYFPQRTKSHIGTIMHYRNDSAHAVDAPKIEEHEAISVLYAFSSILYWWIEDILEKKIDFDIVDKKRNLKSLSKLIEMALADNIISSEEQQLLLENAHDKGISEDELVKLIEKVAQVKKVA